jgi:dihydroxy-acid dehydratase
VALITDGRVSGVSAGAVGVHCTPEAVLGGPIARVQDDDEIEFDLLAGTIEVKADLDARECVIPSVTHPFGYLADFAATVSQAHEGCVPRWTLQHA